jgi:hypothetical protein
VRRQTVIAAATAAVLAASAAVAQATTGPTDNLPKPDVHVPPRVSTPYIGHWVIDQVDEDARVDSGQIALDYTVPPGRYMIGNITLRYYDEQGRPSSFLANLYPFAETQDGGVQANILSQGSLAKLGAITLEKPDHDAMTGTITLHGDTYRVVYAAKSLDDVAKATPPPKARPLGAKRRPAQRTGGQDRGDKRDSGGTSATPQNAGAAAAMYAPAVRLAYQLTE